MDNFINYKVDDLDKECYRKKGFVVLENFFESSVINDLYKTLNTCSPEWWGASTPTHDYEPKIIPYYQCGMNDKEILQRKKLATNTFCTGNLCYRFDRLKQPHIDGCTCNICKFTKLLHSENLLSFCKDFVNDDNIGNIPLRPYYTRYNDEDFLSLHTDSKNKKENGQVRKIAIIIHLAKNWKPWYGGNLMILDKYDDIVRETLTPKFNSVIIMNVENDALPHYVDPMIVGLWKKRYAISMWY